MSLMRAEPGTAIIRTDARGQVCYTREYRDEVLDAFEKSAMTGVQFARHCGVKYQTLIGWVKRRRKARAQAAKAEAAQPGDGSKFLLAEVGEEAPVAKGLSVRLPGGAVASVSSREEVPLLVELIRALG